jgi:hypothetical protein
MNKWEKRFIEKMEKGGIFFYLAGSIMALGVYSILVMFFLIFQ